MNHRHDGRTATVARRKIVRPAKNDYMPRQPGLELPSSRLYVTRRTHGPKEVMAQSDLEVWFSSCGDVQEIKVLKSKEHQARGITKMASVHQATYAMEQLNGHTPPGQPGHDTRPLVVKFAYHNIAKNKPDTFLSNSQQATKRRGCPRPSPRHQKALGWLLVATLYWWLRRGRMTSHIEKIFGRFIMFVVLLRGFATLWLGHNMSGVTAIERGSHGRGNRGLVRA